MLEENMKVGINPGDMEEYLEGFRWGAPPHAGAGVGLERFVMLLLKLGNIRLASLFHRDPKNFPPIPVFGFRHPESSTVEPALAERRTWSQSEQRKRISIWRELLPTTAMQHLN